MRTTTLTLLTACCLAGLSKNYAAETSDNFTELAEQHAPKLVESIRKNMGNNQSYTVGVFPFGSSSGTSEGMSKMGNNPKVIQGELIAAIGSTMKDGSSFMLLDQTGLAEKFKSEGMSPVNLKISDPKDCGPKLRQLGIEALVVGTISTNSPSQAATRNSVPVTIQILFSDGTIDQVFGPRVKPGDIFDNGGQGDLEPDDANTIGQGRPNETKQDPNDTRFMVEFVINGQVIPAEIAKTSNGGFDHVRFIILPGHFEGKEYSIRITNDGSPGCGWYHHEQENQECKRNYAVALLIDGVNSIYERNLKGENVPVARRPQKLTKWFLSGTTEPNPDKPTTIEISGYQTKQNERRPFVLGKAKNSLAAELGITNDIGLITAHFYPEKMQGDKEYMDFKKSNEAGTHPGPPEANPTIEKRLDLYERPAAVWRIFYRYEGDDLPGDLKPGDIVEP